MGARRRNHLDAETMMPRAKRCKVCGTQMLAKGALCQLHWREYATQKMRESRERRKATADQRSRMGQR